MDISDLDLNLLPVLDALLRLRSVSAAARKLDMSQSATSAALARLREQLGDALFVRTSRGILPTPRASQLAEPVSAILEQVRTRVLLAGGFQPLTSSRRFSFALSDVGSYVLWPAMVHTMRAQAPHAGLDLRVLPQAALAQAMQDGEIDVALGAYPGLPDSLFQRRLLEGAYVGVVSPAHPLAGRRLTPASFARAAQIVVRLSSGIQDRVDEALSERGLRRHIAFEMPSYLMLPPLLETGNYLAVMPGPLAHAFNRHGHFNILDLPFPLPSSTLRMHWHRRFNDDPGSVWLRQLIGNLFSSDLWLRPSNRGVADQGRSKSRDGASA